MSLNTKLSGRREEALKIVETLKQRYEKGTGSPYDVGVIYAGLKEKDLALQWLDKAEKERSGALLLLKVDPFFDEVRSDPRFQDVLHRLGLQK